MNKIEDIKTALSELQEAYVPTKHDGTSDKRKLKMVINDKANKYNLHDYIDVNYLVMNGESFPLNKVKDEENGLQEALAFIDRQMEEPAFTREQVEKLISFKYFNGGDLELSESDIRKISELMEKDYEADEFDEIPDLEIFIYPDIQSLVYEMNSNAPWDFLKDIVLNPSYKECTLEEICNDQIDNDDHIIEIDDGRFVRSFLNFR